MYSCSYGMRNLVLLICFKCSIVLCIGSYSCLLFRMCIACRLGVIVFDVPGVFLVA
jgi:hypothetical protein